MLFLVIVANVLLCLVVVCLVVVVAVVVVGVVARIESFPNPRTPDTGAQTVFFVLLIVSYVLP